MVQEDVFILLTARLTGHGTPSALPAVYERNETPPYIYIFISVGRVYFFSLLWFSLSFL